MTPKPFDHIETLVALTGRTREYVIARLALEQEHDERNAA